MNTSHKNDDRCEDIRNSRASSDSNPFHPTCEKGFGVIHSEPPPVYDWCKSKNYSLIIVRDGVEYDKTEYLSQSFRSMRERTGHIIQKKLFVTNPYDMLLYFLKVHDFIYDRMRSTLPSSTENDSSGKNKSVTYFPSNVICIEITSYLPAYMEYIILMYKYLYNIRTNLPQLYAIIPYGGRNGVLDFISSDLFGTFENSNLSMPLFSSLPHPHPHPQPPPQLLPEARNIRSQNSIHDHKLNELVYDMIIVPRSIHFIISKCSIFEKVIKPHITRGYKLYDGIISFFKGTNTSTNNDASIILIHSLEDLLYRKSIYWGNNVENDEKKEDFYEKELLPNNIVFDARMYVPCDRLYSGNQSVISLPNNEYISYALNALKSRYPGASIMSYDQMPYNAEPVVRGIFTRSPIVDICLFLKYNARFSMIYSTYCPNGTKGFIPVIRGDSEMLSKLIGEDRECRESVIRFGIHPIFISMIKKWFDNGWPKFSILIFVAVITTASSKSIEIREPGTREYDTDISQISRYGRILFDYLKLIEERGVPYPADGGRTSRVLFKLSERYGTLGEEYIPDHNEFHKYLVKLIVENYREYILRRQDQSRYRSSYNTQMNWTIPTTVQEPEYIFPLYGRRNRGGVYVTIFVPIDRI
jgi:hypothetical protein